MINTASALTGLCGRLTDATSALKTRLATKPSPRPLNRKGSSIEDLIRLTSTANLVTPTRPIWRANDPCWWCAATKNSAILFQDSGDHSIAKKVMTSSLCSVRVALTATTVLVTSATFAAARRSCRPSSQPSCMCSSPLWCCASKRGRWTRELCRSCSRGCNSHGSCTRSTCAIPPRRL